MYYFILFIPFLIVGLGSGMAELRKAAPGQLRKHIDTGFIALWLGIGFVPWVGISAAYRMPVGGEDPEIVQYIHTNSLPGDPILAWGEHSPPVYILSGRKAPSRYFYQAPIVQTGFNAEFSVCEELLSDLEANPPRLFLNYHEGGDENQPGICVLPDAIETNTPERIFEFVCRRYVFVGQVGDFQVFRLP